MADLVKKQKSLTETHARKLFRQLVSAIQFTHASGIVHRDLKLENILLNEGGNILVSDFGLGTFAYGDKLEVSIVNHRPSAVHHTTLHLK